MFHVILENEWIREYFIVAPPSADKFPSSSPYGCVTLISRLIPVVNIRSLEFESPMARNALMVDLKLSVPGEHSRVVTLRVANTHLESMTEGAETRPIQMTLIGRYLKEDEVYGGIVGGDMNAVHPLDASIPESVGLEDAWKARETKKFEKRKSFRIWRKRSSKSPESSKAAGEDSGFTWGFQPPSEDHPPGRLDKILFVPKAGYVVEEPQVVGQGEKTAGGDWLSDHFGLLTTVHLAEN
jgi:tyrosyl-DNA phosphodiesterase 2